MFSLSFLFISFLYLFFEKTKYKDKDKDNSNAFIESVVFFNKNTKHHITGSAYAYAYARVYVAYASSFFLDG